MHIELYNKDFQNQIKKSADWKLAYIDTNHRMFIFGLTFIFIFSYAIWEI